jgi:hypothetical protein
MYQDYLNCPWPLSVRSQGKLHYSFTIDNIYILSGFFFSLFSLANTLRVGPSRSKHATPPISAQSHLLTLGMTKGRWVGSYLGMPHS